MGWRLGAALIASLIVALSFASSAFADIAGPGSADDPSPDLIAGNPSCATLNANSAYAGITSDYGFKIDAAAPNGTYTFTNPPGVLTGGAPSDPNNSVTISNSDGQLFDWAATMGIDAVIVKAGPNADAFVYVPENLDDSDLHGPLQDGGGYRTISHVEFCYDYNLDVTKTAATTFTRDHDWKVSKKNDTTGTVTLTSGQAYTVNYEVTAETNGYADSAWAVSGNIAVKNPHPTATAAGVAVTDQITGGIDATVNCPDDEIAPGATMTCTYSAALPDGTARTNTATATTTTAGIGSGSGTAAVTFGAPTTVVDDCVQVSDDRAGALGQVCIADSPKTFKYSEQFTFTDQQCGENKITNTATVNQSTGTDPTASSDAVFDVRCPENGGCTLTQGYWKTHSLHGPAPYDDAWLNLGSNGANTVFYLSGKTWYQVFWTAPAGNPYYVLAHQYQAAKLNILNGASSTAAVDQAIAGAEAFFASKTPTSSLTKAQKTQILTWAATLDRYNNGLIGPGHCSEDNTSSQSA